jgi:pyruvate kinase
VERKAAVRNFEGIAHVADGIIISRGNLGLDFEPEVGGRRWGAGQVVLSSVWFCAMCAVSGACSVSGASAAMPCLQHACLLPAVPLPFGCPQVMALLQKRIISRCNQLGKPVLITRIVDTMVTTPRPTRAGTVCGIL